MMKVSGQFLLGVVVGASGLALLAFGHGWVFVDNGTASANGQQVYGLLTIPLLLVLVISVAWSNNE